MSIRADKELIDGWSKQYGRPVTEAEVDEIKFSLRNFFDLLNAWDVDFRKKGLTDKEGNFVEKKP